MPLIYAEDSADADMNKEIIQLSDEEIIVREKVLSFFRNDLRLSTYYNRNLLSKGCGFTILNRPDSYDRKKHPLCKDALNQVVQHQKVLNQVDKDCKELLARLKNNQ